MPVHGRATGGMARGGVDGRRGEREGGVGEGSGHLREKGGGWWWVHKGKRSARRMGHEAASHPPPPLSPIHPTPTSTPLPSPTITLTPPLLPPHLVQYRKDPVADIKRERVQHRQ